MIHQISNDEFALFEGSVKWFQKYYGLTNYEIYCNLQSCKGNRGACEVDLHSRIAGIALNKRYPIADNDNLVEDIKKCAFHEIYEVMLWRLEELATEKTTTPKQLEDARHEIIRIHENTVFHELKDRIE